MRSVVILASGLADTPVADLGGKTPLEVADTPALDELAAGGILGLTRTLPEGAAPLRSMATAALLGVDGAAQALLPGPAAAAGMDVAVSPGLHAACLDLVAIGEQEGVGLCVLGSHLLPIEQREARALAAALAETLADLGIRVAAGVGCRHVALLDGASGVLLALPPDEALGRPLGEVLPQGGVGDAVRLLMSRARALLWEHPACSGLRMQGAMAPTDVWLWGGGAAVTLPALRTRYGVRATAVAVDPIVRGVARLMGLTVTPAIGADALPDLATRARQAAALAAEHELVVLHVETPDAYAHRGDAAGKAQAIARLDAEVVAPVVAALREVDPDWRLLVASDVVASSTTRRHVADPVPFVVASGRGGGGRRGSGKRRFGEREAREEGIFVSDGHTLLERLLRR